MGKSFRKRELMIVEEVIHQLTHRCISFHLYGSSDERHPVHIRVRMPLGYFIFASWRCSSSHTSCIQIWTMQRNLYLSAICIKPFSLAPWYRDDDLNYAGVLQYSTGTLLEKQKNKEKDRKQITFRKKLAYFSVAPTPRVREDRLFCIAKIHHTSEWRI